MYIKFISKLFFLELALTINISAAEMKIEPLTKRINDNFSFFRIDSCLYYSYLQIHHYKMSSDSERLFSTWYRIAIFELLNEHFTRAQAAKQIAEQYHKAINSAYKNGKKHDDSLTLYRSTYWYIYYYMKDEFTSACAYLTNMNPPDNILSGQFKYLLRLFEGNIWYNLDKAEKGKKITENVIEELRVNKDTTCFAYAYSYYILGSFAYLDHDYNHCINNTLKAIQYFESNKLNCKYWILSYLNISRAFWNLGQLSNNQKYLRQLLTVFETNSSLKSYLPYYYYVNARDLRYRNELREALNIYLKAYYSCNAESIDKEKVAKSIFDCYFVLNQHDKVIQWSDSCLAYGLSQYEKVILATSYYKLGNVSKANQLIRSAESGLVTNNKILSDIALPLSLYYNETNNSKKAEYFRKIWLSYELKKNGRVHYNTALVYSSIAYFYWTIKADYDKSLYYYHQNVYSLINSDYVRDLYILPDITFSINDRKLASALSNKAEALYEVSKQSKTTIAKLKVLKSCLDNLELALNVAHRYKMNLGSDEKRLSFADFTQRKYPYIINVCLDLYHITGEQVYANKAFEYAEKSKASLLLSTVKGINAQKMQLLPESLKKEEDQLWTKTELLTRNLSEEYNKQKTDPDKVERYLTLLNGLRKQQDSLINIFKTHYPSYYNAKFNANVISPDSLQKFLKPEEVLLQYSLSANKLVIFLLTKNDLKIFVNDLSKCFFNDVESYRKTMSDFSYNCLLDTSIRAYAATAYRLYNYLIKPAEQYVKGKNLIIVPDDVLTQIPYEALITQPLLLNEPGSLRSLNYLIKSNTIGYSYSGTLYAMYSQKAIYHRTKLLAIAPCYKKTKLSQVYARYPENTKRDTTELFPIPGTFDEIRGVHQIFGGNMLMKMKATEEHFREMANNYDILHMAMHGIINNEYPMFSKLVFVPHNDSINDGFLNTYEIYNMQIHAPLVVLSACNTGYGKLHRGEGMMSLARGFFTAGAKSVVMTLWSVGDKTSSALMQSFYKNLADHQNIGKAMQNAKLQHIEQSDEMKAHPYFWSGYIVLGNNSSYFEPDPARTKYLLWVPLGILLVLAVVILRKKIRRSIKLRR